MGLVLPPGLGKALPPVDPEVFSREKPGVLFSHLVGVSGCAELGIVLPMSDLLHSLVTCASVEQVGW